MINFFRRIRLRLFTENLPSSEGMAKQVSNVGLPARRSQVGKYLIYAIGEILLVVIGILIALQINNWNENKKNTKREIFHLENILTSLQDDLDNQISPCIEKTERQILGFELLKSGFYESNNINNDSIRRLFFQFMAQWD